MSTKNYRPDAEGAVFDRRPTETPSPEEWKRLLAIDPLRDKVCECQELAVGVLSGHYGKPIELVKNEPHTDGEPLLRPFAGTVPEIVLDAFEILDLSRSVRTLERCAGDEVFASNRQTIVRSLANCMLTLGQITLAVRLRLDGIESEVFARLTQKGNLRARDKVEIPEAKLRAEWERVKKLKPHAGKQTWRESVADNLGTSESTIKRRMKEFKIT